MIPHNPQVSDYEDFHNYMYPGWKSWLADTYDPDPMEVDDTIVQERQDQEEAVNSYHEAWLDAQAER